MRTYPRCTSHSKLQSPKKRRRASKKVSEAQISLLVPLVTTEDAPTATAAAGETEEEPRESIWDSRMMKKTVDSITSKAKIECLHCGMVATCDSIKLACNAAKKRRHGMRACVADYSDHCTELCNLLKKIVAAAAAKKCTLGKKSMTSLSNKHRPSNPETK